MSSSSPSSDLRPPTSNRDSDAEVLVRVEGVSKIFCRDLKKSLWYGLQGSAKDLFSWGRKIEEHGSQILDQDPSEAHSSHSKFKIPNLLLPFHLSVSALIPLLCLPIIGI
jgi:hypothetical protein